MPKEYIPSSEWAKPQPKIPDGKLISRIAFGFFLCSVLLVIVSTDIFRETFIDWYKLVIPCLLGSVVFSVALYKKFNVPKAGRWGSIFVCVISGGCLVHFGFMYLNYKLAEKETYSITLPVIHKGELGTGTRSRTKGESYVTVEFNGLKKQVMMNWENDQNISYSKLYIEYSMGKLGYYVIRKKKLVE